MADELYRGHRIINDCPPVPFRYLDWIAVDDDGDGEVGAHGETREACKQMLDETINETIGDSEFVREAWLTPVKHTHKGFNVHQDGKFWFAYDPDGSTAFAVAESWDECHELIDEEIIKRYEQRKARRNEK